AATLNNVAIDADVSASGDSTITLAASAGNVNIAQSVASAVTSADGKVDIDAGTDVLIGTATKIGQVVTTGSGNVDIDAGAAGNITIAGAGSQVNAGGAVNIGQTVLTSNNINVSSGAKVQATGNITVDGDVITVDNTPSEIISTAGNIDLQTGSGAINLEGNITAIGNTVTLNAATQILDTTSGATDISAKTLSATAGTGIGTTTGNAALDTDVDFISLASTATGGIYILEESGVTLTDVKTTTSGSIDITTGAVTAGNAVVTSVVANGGSSNVTITATLGDIYVGTVTATGDTATITSAAGSIYDDDINTTKITAATIDLDAVANIGTYGTTGDIDTAGDVAGVGTTITADSSGPGNIYITDDDAVTFQTVTTNDGSITLAAARSAAGDMTTGTITASGGNVTLETMDGGSATNDIVISGPITASGYDVNLISDYDVVDSYAGGTDITATSLYLQAGNSVGASGNYLDTRVSTIDDYYTGGFNVENAIYISEYDGVDLGYIEGLSTNSGDIAITTNATGDGDLVASSVSAGGAGDIYLTSQAGAGGTNNIQVGYVSALSDNVTLISDNNIASEYFDPYVNVYANILYLEATGYCGTSGTDAGINTDVAYISNRTGSTV
ncbi:MAG: hypothetical protein NTV07_02255, partial [Candidatus Omnitrophica bacterium]|nr:hypothetical protein [Candidatus Omnitrophota bacterium]